MRITFITLALGAFIGNQTQACMWSNCRLTKNDQGYIVQYCKNNCHYAGPFSFDDKESYYKAHDAKGECEQRVRDSGTPDC